MPHNLYQLRKRIAFLGRNIRKRDPAHVRMWGFSPAGKGKYTLKYYACKFSVSRNQSAF
ncbi:hypothetical protein KIM372_17210 [Bombiscardovia nodaiensis]|uniref:Uncharacterized protein n=1 Tax=Bombiscardovia nodaiensis TaxID=2932181 RepID=A0ABN6SDU1_9BIFI|nr:hypothetical protein KIM372_17210 [Bombiscardovia nodaiensis]